MVGALLERLVGLARQHDELGAGDPISDDLPVARRRDHVDLTGDDEGRNVDLRQPVERVVDLPRLELAAERLG